MAHVYTHQTANVLLSRYISVSSSVCEMSYGRSFIDPFRIPVLLGVLLLTLAGSISAGEDSVTLDKNTPVQIGEYAFEIVDIEWKNFSLKISLPIGETYTVVTEKDQNGIESLTIVLYDDNIGYFYFCTSENSFLADNGKLYEEMKMLFRYNEKNDQIVDRITQSLNGHDFIENNYKRVIKLCDRDDSIIFLAEVLCDFDQYLLNILTTLGTMKLDSNSLLFSCFDLRPEHDEWEKYIDWHNSFIEINTSLDEPYSMTN